MLNCLTVPNIILLVGFLLSDTCILYHFVQVADLHYSPWIEDGFFYACTFLQVLAFISYLKLKPLKYFSHAFEFIFLPLFSINFMKEGSFKDKILTNSIRIAVFSLGWILCIIMVVTQYTRSNEQESQSIMKISTSLRIARLVKRFLFFIMVGLQIFVDGNIAFIGMLAFSVIEVYLFLTTFTFQNPFHQYLTMLASFASIISWLDFTFYLHDFNKYTYCGQIFFLLIVFVQPQMFQKLLEYKYHYYGEKNIETRKVNQLLGFFVVAKEIILDQHKTFKYTQDFDNKIHVLLHRMLVRSKIEALQIYEDNTLTEKDFLNQDQVSFLRLIQKRLKQHHEFIVHEFYLITIIRKGLPFKNKALRVYYERQRDKQKASSNIFSKIQMQLLYNSLIKRIETKKNHQLHHDTLVFCDYLSELKQKIVSLCKHEVSLVNSLQNFSSVPIQKYSAFLIERYEMKQEIKAKIDELMKNEWHIHSGDFLYMCLIYKVIFEREQQVIQEKITKNFIIPLALESRKSKAQLEDKKNTSIVVFSAEQKGEIINENEMFSKNYGKTVKSGQKSRKFITELFSSQKQRISHQQAVEQGLKAYSLQVKDHSSYECWINRKVLIQLSKFTSESFMICTVEKVRISTRIYYEMTEREAFICTIEQLEDDIGFKVLSNELNALNKKEKEFEILNTLKVTQLNEEIEINHILIKDWQDSREASQSDDHITISNISQNLVFALNTQTGQSKKILKIQKEYDKEEVDFNPRKFIILAALVFPVLSLLIKIGVNSYQEKEIQKSINILESEKFIFQSTILNQKYVGLHLIMFQLADQGIFQPGMCAKYQVPNLKDYVISSLKNYALNNFDQIQISQTGGVLNDQNLLNLFGSDFYKSFDMKDPFLTMNYVKYGSMTKSSIFQYASAIGEVTLDEWCKKSIQKVINLSQIDMNGLYTNLRSLFQQKFNYLTKMIDFILIFLLTSNTGILLAIIFIFYNLINFKYTHIKLLKGFKKPFIQGRVRQIDYIMIEMSRIQKNQISDISISKNMTISMLKNSEQKVLDLNEFQRQSFVKMAKNGLGQGSKSISVASSSHIEEEKERLIDHTDLEQDNEKENPLFIMLQFHKNKVIVLLLLFIVLGGLDVVHSGVLKQKSSKNVYMQDTFYEMSRLFTSMNDLLIGEVIKYSDQQTYSSKIENQMRIAQAINELQTNHFQQKVFDLFPKNMSDFILYSSYCRTFINSSVCEKVKSKVLNNGLSSIVAFLPADYNATWSNRLSKNMTKIQENEVCEKLVIFLNYTMNMLPQNLIIGYQNMQKELANQGSQLRTAQMVVYALMIVGIVVMAEVIVGRGRKVRSEALSMDTKQNLYDQHERYRPFLNILYYREVLDDIE